MENKELAKAYNPKEVEDKWYQAWLEKGFFTANPLSDKPAYSVVIPPPNVTGVLTMGHVLNNTLQDILVRRKHMQGFEVLWLPGTDHAGIATETVVARTLKKEGKIRHRDDMSREEFLKRVWEWKDKHGGIIIKQLKKLGVACDWSREIFTMDGMDERHPVPRVDYAERVRAVFVDLYNKGLIYRGLRMVNWCPVSRTALSDEEVEMKETDGHLWYFKYPLCGKTGSVPEYIVVATTRPETMLGDEAVAVNPKDKRYKHLVGRKVLLPLQNKEIPIIADSAVEPCFGTGAVKVTPAHDPADYDISLRHGLPITTVIGKDGLMTETAGEKFEGLDRFECRKAIVADLQELGLLEKTENYRHSVGFSQRADVPVEPMLSEQWFLKYPSLKKALSAVQKGTIKFWPPRWAKVYSHWLKNIRDWCISRQLWWGHRIPAWYCTTCPPVVSINQPEKCPHCGGAEFRQDTDVLDTWFSSWLWPFATMGWPSQTPELKKFYPTSDLVTGPDIIFFWVARMIMAGYEFMGKEPFKNVYFTGIIRDGRGRKMSKSLGNSPDPLDLIDKYGADGLRFGLMLIAPKGQDILFDETRIETGRNFMNKLWNASRFIMMNLCTPNLRASNLTLADKWILNRLAYTTREVNKALDCYQFDTAAKAIYQFAWGEFCDWYLELSKSQISDPELRNSTQEILLRVLDGILRMLHPFAPFITEEIWKMLNTDETIMRAAYPLPPKKIEYAKESKEMQAIMDVIGAIRNIRGEHNVPPAKLIKATVRARDKGTLAIIEKGRKYVRDMAAAEIEINLGGDAPKSAATAVAGKADIFVPLSGMIDVAAERERLGKEIARAEKFAATLEQKLSNKNFTERAPKEIVEKEREKLRETSEEARKLRQALADLENL